MESIVAGILLGAALLTLTFALFAPTIVNRLSAVKTFRSHQEQLSGASLPKPIEHGTLGWFSAELLRSHYDLSHMPPDVQGKLESMRIALAMRVVHSQGRLLDKAVRELRAYSALLCLVCTSTVLSAWQTISFAGDLSEFGRAVLANPFAVVGPAQVVVGALVAYRFGLEIQRVNRFNAADWEAVEHL